MCSKSVLTKWCSLVLLTVFPLFAKANTEDAAFTQLADRYIDQFYLPTNPSQATVLGVHLYDNQIEDYSEAAIQKEIATLKNYEQQFTAIDPNKLTPIKQGDRDLILNNIRSQRLTLETIRLYQTNPDMYSSAATTTAFVILEREYAPLEERLKQLIAREKQIPAMLQQARTNLKNPPLIYTQIALEQLPGIIQFFRQEVPAAFKKIKQTTLQHEFTKTNDEVIHALQAYQQWIKTDLLPRSKGDFRLGENTFRQKLLYDEMVDMPLAQLTQIGMDNLRQNQQEFARIAKQVDPGKTPQQVLQALAQDHPRPDHLLKTFHSRFDHLIQFIKQKQLITIPSTIQPTLEETPPFLRAITFASMDIPGPFEQVANEAYFNVTLPEKSWDKTRVNQFMASFNYPVISSISVHEAYPGHYIQFLWIRKNPDRVRKIFGANSNAEGWAHYCEQMMIEEGLGTEHSQREANLLRLGYLQEALLRNARFIVSIKLHTGQMRFDDAVAFFQKEGYQSKAVALVETKRGTMDPTYLYYTLGKLEILKLRSDLQKKQGQAFHLGEFHNRFMEQGFPPIKIVRKTLLGDDSSVL